MGVVFKVSDSLYGVVNHRNIFLDKSIFLVNPDGKLSLTLTGLDDLRKVRVFLEVID